MKVLVADDSPTTRFALRKKLTDWGYEVEEAADGQRAWNMLNRPDPPAIAILDWVMPEMDGVTVCRKLHEQQGAQLIYTILLTGKSEKEDMVHALDSGAHDYLSKPVFPEELRSRIAVGRRLVEMHQLKSRFLGIAAHDLRNPLVSIRGFAELMLEGVEYMNTAEHAEFLRLIVNTSSDMLALINDLLDVSAIVTGKLELRCTAASLKPVIEQRIRLLGITAAKKDVVVAPKLEDVPPVHSDPRRLAQVFDNLLGNAIKFSPPGSTVEVGLRLDGDRVMVSVKDQGPGISAADRTRLFGEFQRLGARPTGGEASSGLGLAIAKKIVEAHHGSLEVESQEGQGATFTFSIPVT